MQVAAWERQAPTDELFHHHDMVRIWQANIEKTIIAHVPITDYEVQETGDFELDGVTFPAAEVQIEFIDPADGGGAIFPTGNLVDELEVPGVGKLQATIGLPLLGPEDDRHRFGLFFDLDLDLNLLGDDDFLLGLVADRGASGQDVDPDGPVAVEHEIDRRPSSGRRLLRDMRDFETRVPHDLAQVERIADQQVTLEGGRVVAA